MRRLHVEQDWRLFSKVDECGGLSRVVEWGRLTDLLMGSLSCEAGGATFKSGLGGRQSC